MTERETPLTPTQLQLLQRARAGDKGAEAELVQNNLALVHSITRRFRDRGCDYDDLFQLGCVGLVKAIRHFDTAYQVRFSTYAVPMIMGEIRRFLRDDGLVKVSRTIKERARTLMAAHEQLKDRLQRQPTLEELSVHTGIPREEVAQVMEATAPIGSIDEEVEVSDGTMRLVNSLRDERETPERQVDRLLLQQLLDTLPERERNILYLRYYQERTQSEIARQVGVSQVQISRIESRVLRQLRAKLQD